MALIKNVMTLWLSLEVVVDVSISGKSLFNLFLFG